MVVCLGSMNLSPLQQWVPLARIWAWHRHSRRAGRRPVFFFPLDLPADADIGLLR